MLMEKESTMKLYYSPGACSLAPHIALNEAGLKYDLEKVDLASKKTESGKDYNEINAKGYVPALILDNGELLTEAAIVLQYISAQVPQKLSPDENSFEYYRFKEWLNFISSELHKGIGFFFRKNLTNEVKNSQSELVSKRLKFLDSSLPDQGYLMGENFTAADAYLFTVLRWAYYFKLDLSGFPKINQYFEKVKQRPHVQKTLAEENLK